MFLGRIESLRLNERRNEMVTRILVSIVVVSAIVASLANGNASTVLWNQQCPCSYAVDPRIGEQLKREIPDFDSDFRLQLEWKGGSSIADPNEKLMREMSLTKNIIHEVFKAELIPAELTGDRFLLLHSVNLREGRRDALVCRFRRDKYIVKIMKTRMAVYITIRSATGKTPEDIVQLSQDIFTDRVKPARWGGRFFLPSLKRESRVLRAGMWSASDTWKIDDSGRRVKDPRPARLPTRYGPIGLGLYDRVYFYAGGGCAMFRITGGPKMRDREYRGPSAPQKEKTDN